MSTASPGNLGLALRLIAVESARAGSRVAAGGEVARVCDRMRGPLARLAGGAGFRSLLSRALTLAKAEDPSLAAVMVRADGTLEGLDDFGHPERAATPPGADIVAQLLGLLDTFIGISLTARLVGDAWPDEPVAGGEAAGGGGQ